MKYNFKQIFALGTSALLIGMTAMAGVGAANYPAPFVVGGQANVAVVYGTGSGVSATDQAQATLIASGLMGLVSGGITTVTGDSVSLASGSDLLYLNDELNENVEQITKDDLPDVLADGTFTDDSGTNYNFEQTVTIGSHADNHFAFGNSDNDLDDPTLVLELSDTDTNDIYAWAVTFNEAVNFTSSDSEGEEISIFGKPYTVGTATDSDTLILLGGSDAETIAIGATATLTVGTESYSVTLNGISDAAIPVASITVDGETKTFTEEQTKSYTGDIDLFVKTIFRTGENAGHVEIQLGADKLTLETASAVQVGSDNDDIDGTLVTLTPADATGVQQLTKIQIEVAAEDNDANHLLVGESFIDPVFGTMKVNFASVLNGPIFTDEKDTGRTALEIQKGGNRELQLMLTDKGGNTATVPFTYQDSLQDDNGDDIEIVEGAYIADDEYFILNSGNNQHLMQLTKANLDAGTGSDVAMKDIITGDTYTFDNHNFASGYSAAILGQTYTITNVSATEVTIVSSDYGTGIADGNDVDVFPMIELVSGEDTRVAFTEEVLAMNEFITGIATTVTLNLPTGTATVVANATADSVVIAGTRVALDADDSLQVGDVWYNFNVTDGTAANATDIWVAIDAVPGTGVGDVPVTTPGILFVEDEDKSETTTTTKPAIHIVTTDGGTYSTVSTPLFTGTVDTETWDDTDFTGWLTNYGTYVWRDTGDTNQNFVGLSYGDAIMYAEVYFAESGAVVSGDGIDAILVTDAEVSTVQSKNLVVVGGSCINSVAATLVGGSLCTTSWTTETEVGTGQFLIKSYANPYATGKVALLVAGYAREDTVNAATYLRNIGVNTVVGKTYIGTTATQATLQVS